jgi:hypothetical protein
VSILTGLGAFEHGIHTRDETVPEVGHASTTRNGHLHEELVADRLGAPGGRDDLWTDWITLRVVR